MGRDYKIGLVCGLVPATAALIWLATRPGLSPEARMMRTSQVQSYAESRAPSSPAALGFASPSLAPRADDREHALPSEEHTTNPAATAGSAPNLQPAANPPDLTIYEQPQKIKTTRFHIVRKDETLSAISQQYFGSPNQWRKILDANRSLIPDANKLRPGTKLIIPEQP
jgi:nucleoid-associated protein YgaU